MLRRLDYRDAREQMRPGDVLAFGGKGRFSDCIKAWTESGVSHVGVVLRAEVVGAGRDLLEVIESTSLHGFSGVTISRVSDRVRDYGGEVWWLPLAESVRARLDAKRFYDFLLSQDRKPYDLPGAIRAALDRLDALLPPGFLTRNDEEYDRFFCSELAAAALEAGGAVKRINASEVTPANLCSFALYSGTYYQLKGNLTAIVPYNEIDPEGFGCGEAAAA